MRFLDLFAGIGGFRLGLEQAGHECVGFCEIDKFARNSYKAIHNTEGEIEYHDIKKVTDEEWRELRRTVDIICGGFPCQSFSISGKRLGFEDSRGTLFFEIARAAKQIQPRFLFLENVKGLLSHDKGATFAAILTTLDELGYDVEWQVLNSKDFGVPQNRERVYIIGHLRGGCGGQIFPLGESGEAADHGRVLTGTLTARYPAAQREGTYIEQTRKTDIIVAGHLEKSGTYTNDMTRRVYAAEGLSPTLHTMQGGGQEPKILMPQVSRENGKRQVTHTESDVVPTVLATQYKSGDTQAKVVIPVLTPERDEKRQNGRRFKENGEDMFTLTAQDRHGIMIKNNSPHTPALEARHGDNISFQPKARGSVRKGYSGTVATQPDGVLVGTRIRKLTPRECWRLQAFPDSAFDAAQAVNSDSQLYKQAGNSVTVSVIRAIGERLE